jgi:hypothetical protein
MAFSLDRSLIVQTTIVCRISLNLNLHAAKAAALIDVSITLFIHF